MKQKLLHWLGVLFIGISMPVHAQVIAPLSDKTDKVRLEQIRIEASSRSENVKQQLENFSKRPDWAQSRYAKYYQNGRVYGVEAILPDGTVLVNEINSNVGAANTTRASSLWTGGSLGLNLNGEGTTFGVWEAFDTTPEGVQVAAVLPTHQELNGRVTIMDGAPLPGGRGANHATHVAGTLAALGVVPDAKGMASRAQILSYDVTNDAAEMAAAAAGGLVISQHSYGVNAVGTGVTEAFRGAYSVTAQRWDEIANAAPNYLMVKSAGNNGSDGTNPAFGTGYNVLTTSSNSKNVLVVANASIVNFYSGPSSVVITASSSRGPTDDGRIKPDITGAGTSIYSPIGNTATAYNFLTGTSMSGPNVSGSAALLQQHWRNLFSGVSFRSATLRGLIIHTADEAGIAPGPDYIYGWGLMNTARAAQMMSHVAASGTQHVLQQNILNNGGTLSTNVVATGSEPLRFTIAWNDPAATGSDAPTLNDFTARLRNDLDLRITDNVTGTVFFPWTMPYQTTNPPTVASRSTVATQAAQQNADNNRDNVEQVVVFTPVPGRSYTVSITHKGTLVGGSQEYALLGSGIGGTPITGSQATNTADSRIENVTFSTINNTSNTAGVCTGYTDFRQSVTAPSLFAGQSVNFSVTLGTCGANANKHVRMYVDWNGDGDFDDSGELIAQSTAAVNGTGVATLNASSVTVPNNVSVDGLATLRVVCVETSNVNDIQPTGAYLKGETEDYLVRFTRPSSDVGVESFVSPSGSPCAGTIPVTVRIRNFGTGAVSNVPVQFTVNGGAPVTATFTGTIAGGGIATFTVGTFSATPNTPYAIAAQTTLSSDANAANNSRTLNITSAVTPSILSTTAITCGAVNPTDLLTLIATTSGSADAVQWFDQPTGGNRIAAGNNASITKAVVDALPNANTVYAGLNEFSATNVGPANTTLGAAATGGYAQATVRPIFNVTAPFRITSARMYISESASGTTPTGTPGTPVGSIIFRVIRQSDGQIMSTSIVQARVTSAAGDIFPVDILFPATGTYELGIEYEGTFGVFRNNSAVPTTLYPINLGPAPSVGQIVNTTAPGTTFYYWLYDMTLTSASCPVGGARTPVTISTSAPLTANVTPSGSVVVCDGNTVTLNANTGTGLTYQWQRRNGTTGTFTNIAGANGASFTTGRLAASPITANEQRQYRVIITRADGCQTISDNVTVTITPWPAQVRIIPQNGSTQLCTGATPNLLLRASATIGLNNNTTFVYTWRRNGDVVATGTGTGANGWQYTATQTGEYTVTITPNTAGATCSMTSAPVTITNETPMLSNLNAVACEGSPVQLSGTATSGNIHWYTAATGGTWLGTGNSITAPAITTPTTYYAAVNEFTGTVPSPTMGTGGFMSNFGSGFMYFNAEQPFQINSLSMRLQNTAGTAGTVTLFLLDKDFGGVIASRGWSIPANTAPANFNLGLTTNPLIIPEAGNNYTLLVQFTGAGMAGYLTETGLSYPYRIPGVASFTGTNQPVPTSVYFYVHNIQVSTLGCATTPRTAVQAIPGPATATLSASAAAIELCDGQTTNLSVALTGRAPWSLTYSNGTTNTTVNNITASPYVINVGTAGNYSLVSVSDANNCATGNTVSNNTIAVTLPPRIGVAQGATAVAAGGTVNFGTTTYGAPVDVTLTLSNTCNSTLNITSLPVTGPFSVVGATLPIAIPAGGSTDLTVRLLANAAGVANGTLTVNSNAVNEPSFVINLNGTVNKATVTVRATDRTMYFNTPIPAFTFTVTGLQFGQTLASSGIIGRPAITTTAVLGSPVGMYPINIAVGTLASANYDFTFVDGILRIIERPAPIPPPPSGLNLTTLPVLQNTVFNPQSGLINPQMQLQNGSAAQRTVSGPIEPVFERGQLQGYRITGAGTVCFTFFGEANTNSRAQVCFNVAPAACGAITFAALSDVAWNTNGQQLVASSPCGGVNFRVVNGPADIADGMVRPFPRSAGTVTVEASVSPASLDVNRDGVADFIASAPVQRTFRVLPIAQTITFNNLSVPRADVGIRLPLSAFASSGLPVTLTVVSGNGRIENNMLLITGGGEIVIEATQGGNEAWLPATPVRRSIEGVVPPRIRQSQVLTFNLPPNNLQNGFVLSATASSNLPVSFTVVEGGAFTRIDNNSLVIVNRPTTATRITIEATQGGNDDFNPAAPVRRSFQLLPSVQSGGPTVLLSTGTLCQGSSIRAQLAGNFGADVALRLIVSDNQGNFNGGEGFIDARLEGNNTLVSYQTSNLATGTYRVRIDVATADGTIVGTPSTASFQLVAGNQLLGIEEGVSATGTRTLRSPIAAGNSWTRDGQAVGNGQMIEATQPGWYVLTVQAGNCTFTATTFVSANGRTEAEESAATTSEGRNGFKVYPNPSSGMFTLQGRQSVDGAAEVIISDMQGRVISRQSISGRQMNEIIDLGGTASGVYLLQIRQADGKVWTEKLVKE